MTDTTSAALDQSTVTECRGAAWAVRSDTLAEIAGVLRAPLQARAASRPTMRSADGSVVAGGAIAVIPLRGLITPRASFFSLLFGGGGGLQGFRAALRDALADDAISTILIDVDSPGGMTDLVTETAAEIRAARDTKPIVAIADTDAASAAYWIASQADELIVTPSGEVGSIGVYALHTEFSGMDAQDGITNTLIRAGRFKAEANPWEPLSDEARAAIQQRVDDVYGMFVADVAQGRGVSASDVINGFGEGRMVSAQNAVDLGMADRVETFEEAVARLAGGPSPTRASALAVAQEAAADESAEPAEGSPAPQAAETEPSPSRSDTPPAVATATDATQTAEELQRIADVLFG